MALPGLYLHIPFCKTKCGYCDFYSSTDTYAVAAFLHALEREIELWRGEFPGFDTVYLGGGTPSLLKPVQIEILLGKVFDSFTIMPGAEITIEANPADLSLEDLTVLRTLGINRINFGVQSFNDAELAFLGRRHDVSQAMRSLSQARRAGFDNVGLDLIYSLPGQTLDAWRASLTTAFLVAPEHLSCYELELKEGTPLGDRFGQDGAGTPSEELKREFFMRTSEAAEEAGYVHYEISNFAAGIERASRHNRKYWDHTPYLGLGPSAHSFRGSTRWWNHGSLETWLRDLEENRRPMSGREELDAEDLALEALMLSLRMREGIDCEAYRQRYGIDLLEEKGDRITEWARAGLVVLEGGVIRPTRAGMAVADALAAL
jgi:oxygen-independent coproporphyrinogen-3 oxidase